MFLPVRELMAHLRRLVGAFESAGPAARDDRSGTNGRLDQAPVRLVPPHRARSAHPTQDEIVALLVPGSAGALGSVGGERTFRLRAAPDLGALPEHLPGGAGSIYRTHDGRIELDWPA